MIELKLALTRHEFQLEAEFSVAAQGVTAIFGPSGCGKTTLLRAIAGLESDVQGEIRVAGHCWLDSQQCMPVQRRQVGLLFQHPSLFPHLSVEENLLYGRKRLNRPSNPIDFNELIDSLGVRDLLARKPAGLSGGELQRVALGRALLAEPKLLLMDEPLAALDQGSRAKLMSFLEKFLQSIDIPVLYVSHSSEEVARLADNLVLMSDGRVTDFGEIQTVLGAMEGQLSRSDSAFSVIEGTISEQPVAGLTVVQSLSGMVLRVPQSANAFQPDSRVRLRIRARDVSLCLEQPSGSSILNILPARIIEMTDSTTNGSRLIKLDLGGEQLLSMISDYSAQQLNLQIGTQLFAQIKSVALLG